MNDLDKLNIIKVLNLLSDSYDLLKEINISLGKKELIHYNGGDYAFICSVRKKNGDLFNEILNYYENFPKNKEEKIKSYRNSKSQIALKNWLLNNAK